MKKQLAVLIAVFLVFLIAGAWYNLPKGIYFGDDFWKRSGEGKYVGALDDSVEKTGAWELTLNLGGKRYNVHALPVSKEQARVEYSDGWTVEIPTMYQMFVSVGGGVYSSSASYSLNESAISALSFSELKNTEVSNIYTGDGSIAGRNITLFAGEGEVLASYDVFSGEKEKETKLMKAGDVFQADELESKLFVNEENEYLLNQRNIDLVYGNSGFYNRGALSHYVYQTLNAQEVRRGEIWFMAAYAVIYLCGALTVLFPEKIAFFGRKWQFEEEPELSWAGLIAAKAGGVLCMVLSVIVLFGGIGA